MAMSMFHLRSTFTARSCLSLRIKLLYNKAHFADDSSSKLRLYETLGVSPNATLVEIKKAYYDLTLRYHPDRNENCDISSTKFKEITEAYEILGNFSLRKKYDRGIPVADMKKSVSVPVEHSVKYQEFFDSRTAQKDFKDRSTDFDEYASFPGEKVDENVKAERLAAAMTPPKATQLLIVAYFCVLLLLFKK